MQMLSSVRWRIAIMFVALSGVLYLVLSLLGLLAFGWSLDSSIDEQLRVLVSEFGHAIELNGDKPHFRDWLRVVQTEPARSLASIQLFNSTGNLIEHYGPPGPVSLYKTSNRIAHFRLRISPLTLNSRLMGFLQISMPTGYRDEALQKLELTALFLAPFLLLGLGLTSYVVSDAATAPISENLKMLKRFFQDASHELNTPLSILQARSELLARRIDRWEKDTEDIRIIVETTERMSKIVSDLMLLAEIDGTLALPSEGVCRLDQVLLRILAEYGPKCVEKNISIQSTPCPPLSLCIPKEILQRILSNLIENAWRYTDPGGKIIVSTSHENSLVRIVVEDTGIGIPADSLPLIFDRFYRVDKSRSRASGGLGLGLSIVKALVDSNQGQINVRSKITEGTVFSVTLPKAN